MVTIATTAILEMVNITKALFMEAIVSVKVDLERSNHL
jgi:hypothetical protein